MKKYFTSIIFFLILILNFNFMIANEEVDKTTYDLSLMSMEDKIHVFSEEKIDILCDKGLYIIGIPKEAYNLNISPSKISYKIYSQEDKNQLEKDTSWCNPIEPNYIIRLNSDEKIILLDLSKITESSVIVKMEYDQPKRIKKTNIFNNWAGFMGNYSNINIILPPGSNLWDSSAQYSNKELNDGNLIIRWENLTKLEITFGSPSEYLIYDFEANNYLNNYITISILILTIILTFIFTDIKNTSKQQIWNDIFFYISFLILLTLIFLVIPIFFGRLLSPFTKSYNHGILSFFIFFVILSVIIAFSVCRWKRRLSRNKE